MRRRLAPLAVALALVAAACSTAATPASTGSALTVYAASSLTATMARARVAYEAANPGVTVTISTDSSTSLATKIEQGAPADVLLSADTTNPQRLEDEGLAAGTVTVFARNQLTVIVPAANPARIANPADLARLGVKVITCADNVPIARYTQALVANLARLPGYPTDFAARYAANVASKEANVSAIVTKVELGEGDAGIVYATDARASSKVTAIAVPDAANVLASYGAIVVKASRQQAAAQAFLAWLTGPAGRSVLADFGFLSPAA